MSQTLKREAVIAAAGNRQQLLTLNLMIKETEFDLNAIVPPKEPEYKYLAALTLVTLLAIYTRFTKLGTPNKVVLMKSILVSLRPTI